MKNLTLTMKKLLDKIPWQIKFILLFVLVAGTMWLSWDLSRVLKSY